MWWRLRTRTGPDKERDLPPLLIGAHYDTVSGSPGADDNASGLVVLPGSGFSPSRATSRATRLARGILS